MNLLATSYNPRWAAPGSKVSSLTLGVAVGLIGSRLLLFQLIGILDLSQLYLGQAESDGIEHVGVADEEAKAMFSMACFFA